MSLILDALRKLDREKGVPSRGFVVLAPSPRAASASWGALLLAVGLGVAIVAAIAFSLRPLRPVATPLPAPPPPRALVPATPSATLPPAAVVEPLALPKAVPSSAISPPVFVLEAISVRDGVPVAVVNDHLVKEGDFVDGARILRIGTDEVEIEVAGKNRVVHF